MATIKNNLKDAPEEGGSFKNLEPILLQMWNGDVTIKTNGN
jgi:hypothetical protein